MAMHRMVEMRLSPNPRSLLYGRSLLVLEILADDLDRELVHIVERRVRQRARAQLRRERRAGR